MPTDPRRQYVKSFFSAAELPNPSGNVGSGLPSTVDLGAFPLSAGKLPKANAEQESAEETNGPETATEKIPASPEAAEGDSGRTLRSADSDDLTTIKGVGSAMKKKLASLGVTNLVDLAASDPEDLATKLSGSSATRVKGWIDAAQDRIAGSLALRKSPENVEIRSHRHVPRDSGVSSIKD